MIAHVSIPADDCRLVAQVLAELMGGGALPFPPGGPTAWNVWSTDAKTQVVVTPRGNLMVPGVHEVEWTQNPGTPRASETHFAMCVELPAQQILQICERVGWPARVCHRGNFFQVIEVWIEGAYLVELLDPTFQAQYDRSMTVENWTRHFGNGSAA